MTRKRLTDEERAAAAQAKADAAKAKAQARADAVKARIEAKAVRRLAKASLLLSVRELGAAIREERFGDARAVATDIVGSAWLATLEETP